MSTLGPQFPKPGDTQEFEGVPHHFAGWHASEHADFKIKQHQFSEEENQLGAEPGDLYASHTPQFWAEPGWKKQIHEVWSQKKPDTYGGLSDEHLLMPEHKPRVGRSYEFDNALLHHVESLHEQEYGSRPSRAPKWKGLT